MSKYTEIAEFVLKNIGGKENIENVSHCMTRLRFDLKDPKAVNEKEILKNTAITTAQWAGGKYQVVVGTAVASVYEEIVSKLGRSVEQNTNSSQKEESLVNRFIAVITQVITPVLGVLTAAGLTQGILALLVGLNLLVPTDGAYIVLSAMGNALFTFFPIILGYTSAKAFKMNPYVGMAIGASLVFPTLTTSLASGTPLYTLFEGSAFAAPVYKTFFGLPIIFPSNGYTTTVIPIILSMVFASKVEGFLKKYIPDIVGFTFIPLLTLLFAVIGSILVIGPISNILSSLITITVSSLVSFSPILAAVVIALIYQPLVIFGLHWPLITIAITNFFAFGSDNILPMIFTASFCQTAVVLAVFLRTKSNKVKAISIPAMISGLFCIIEPAIYGITLPVKKRFLFSMIGGAVGAVILTFLSLKTYAISVGVLGFFAFINPTAGNFNAVYIAIAATLVASVVSFTLTYVTFNEQEPVSSEQKSITVKSPLKGQIIALENVKDNAFSNGVIGEGLAIIPTEGKVYSPCNGVLTTMFPTGHALGITSDDGYEVLIHIGIDTVQLAGKHFKQLKTQGSRVKEGEVILEFNLDEILKAGYNLESPIIITNSGSYAEVVPSKNKNVVYLGNLLTLQPIEKGNSMKVLEAENIA